VQIRILVSNLLSNAIRYNHVGGSVTLRIQSEPGRGVLAVSDTGPGLAPAVAARVFERFWRATSARSTRDGGTGLGLAISKAIVTTHGGEISVESEPGQGTTFVVWLAAGEPTATPPLDHR
jgi:signal transduction histidine kinase